MKRWRVGARCSLYLGDCLEVLRRLRSASVQMCVTSPPYWGLRDYGVEGQFGLEATPEKYVAQMVAVFREIRRVLRDDGTVWMNLGDCYNGIGGPGKQNGGPIGKTAAIAIEGTSGRHLNTLKPKDLCGIPWRVAFALQADGWYLRSDIIWHKPNVMPSSVRDRPTTCHEYLFLLSKAQRYYYNKHAILEPLAVESESRYKYAFGGEKLSTLKNTVNPTAVVGSREAPRGRNKRTVWTVTTKPYRGAHFATYPPDLIRPCILAGSCPGSRVLDPFAGSGTTLQVCIEEGRKGMGIELNPEYYQLAKARIRKALSA